MRTLSALTVALVAAACASAPPAPPAPVEPTFEQKIGWILRLEDQRMLRDPAPPVPVAPPAPVVGRGQRTPIAPLPPPPVPDLVRLLSDEEARVRRRSALAVGRVGLRQGVEPLLVLLADSDPEVRKMAAFALGLLGDPRALESLVAALNDPSPLVKGGAAEALGLIGGTPAVDALGRFVMQMVESGLLAQTPGEDEDARRDTPAAAFRLGVHALARLKAYDHLAAAVLDGSGRPRVRWWPVAYALQRLGDPRALNALMLLAKDPHPYTRAFAVKGLGALKNRAALPTLLPLLAGTDREVVIETVRALGQIGDPSAAPPLIKMLQDGGTDPHVRLEAVRALGHVRAPGVYDLLLDALSDSSPAVRAAALQSAARVDPDAFVAVLSGLDVDPDWTVRAALASVLGTLVPHVGLPRLTSLLNDSDQRVIPAVIESLVKLHAPTLEAILLDRLKAEDPVARAAAATGLGELKPPWGAQALAAAYTSGERDSTFVARAAVLAALMKYGPTAAAPVLRAALADKDWAVRLRAAMFLKEIDPSAAADLDAQIRPRADCGRS